ncbi:MAG TPA: hypothetical protein VIB98_06425, partial [Gemmatimonadaceae bacterium]
MTEEMKMTDAMQGETASVPAKAQSLMTEARAKAQERVRSAASTGKNSAVDTLSGLSQTLSIASQQLSDQHNIAANVIEQAAERVDRIARYFDHAGIDDLVDGAEGWARRNPAVFIGAAFVLGAMGARFLKASRAQMPSSTGSSRSAGFSDR